MDVEKNNQAQKDKKTLAKALMKSKIKAAANSTTLPSDSSMRVDAGEPAAQPLASNSSKRGCGSGDVEWRYRVALETVDRKHTCRECNEKLCRSEILLEARTVDGQEDPFADKNGYLRGRCFTCVTGRGPRQDKETHKDLALADEDLELALERFHKQVKRKHDARTKAAANQLKNLRSATFNDIMDFLKADLSTQAARGGAKSAKSKKQLVNLAYGWMRDAADAIRDQIKDMTQEQREHILKGQQRYEESVRKMAEGKDHVAVTDGLVLDQHALDYADHILPNYVRYYLCRRRNCLGVFRNIDWITTDVAIVTALQAGETVLPESGGYQFRCPLCGEQYRQDAPAANAVIGANQLFMIQVRNQWRAILAQIPSAAEAGLLAAMTEATHDMMDPALASLNRAAQLKELLKVIQTKTVPVHMRAMEVTFEAKRKINTINESSTKKQWYYSHLKDGINGFTLRDDGVKKLFGITSEGDVQSSLVMAPEEIRKFVALLRKVPEQRCVPEGST